MDETVKILFLPENRFIVVNRGENLLKAAMRADVHINASCGGAGSCGKCRVVIEKGEVEREPNPKLTGEDIDKGYAMACQAAVLTDWRCVSPWSRASATNASSSEPNPCRPTGIFSRPTTGRSVCPRGNSTRPPARCTWSWIQPSLDDNIADAERVKRTLAVTAGIKNVVIDYRRCSAFPTCCARADGTLP